MKPKYLRKLLGGFSVITGLAWMCIALMPLLNRMWDNDFQISDILFWLTMVPMMIPAVIAVVYGARLFMKFREDSLRWVIGVFAVVLTFLMSSQLSEVSPSFLPESLQESLILFASSIAATMFYLHVVRYLTALLTQESRACRYFLSRGVSLLMAWQVWMILSQVFCEYSPIKEGYTHVPEEPWSILGLVIPILVAWVFYQLLSQAGRLSDLKRE